MRLRDVPRNLALLLCVFTASFAGPADAHNSRAPLNTSGLPIANLTHGQLHVMDRYRNAIVDLAARQVSPDVETRTLYNFVNLQFAYCLWGLVPGALTNEDNPFNGCSHAYLAGSKALLDQLQRSSGDPAKANELASRIQSDMLRENTALQICSNGAAPLNTGEIILPEWAGVPFNPLKTLLIFIGICILTGLLLAGFRKSNKEAA
ncbi:hypothetical protein [Hyphomicrobium sp. 99]|uniref:hypothetical protein n=1 Tax=Hyphomicrobium sp. 99 TaxID=1163419 RepID=UPI00069764A5|nr:hypothetical protein [Hyphomicrobium sp. 99]